MTGPDCAESGGLGTGRGSIVLLLTTAALALSSATAQVESTYGVTSSVYQDLFDLYSGPSFGYRLTDVSVYQDSNAEQYASIWKAVDSGPWFARHGISPPIYREEVAKFTRDGFELVLVSAAKINGRTKFACIFEEQQPGSKWLTRSHMSGEKYQRLFDQFASRGYRPTVVTGYAVRGVPRFATVWKKLDEPFYAHHGITRYEFESRLEQYTSLGFNLIFISGFNAGGRDFYNAIWVLQPQHELNSSRVARYGMTPQEYGAAQRRFTRLGFTLDQVSGYSIGRGRATSARFAAIW